MALTTKSNQPSSISILSLDAEDDPFYTGALAESAAESDMALRVEMNDMIGKLNAESIKKARSVEEGVRRMRVLLERVGPKTDYSQDGKAPKDYCEFDPVMPLDDDTWDPTKPVVFDVTRAVTCKSGDDDPLYEAFYGFGPGGKDPKDGTVHYRAMQVFYVLNKQVAEAATSNNTAALKSYPTLLAEGAKEHFMNEAVVPAQIREKCLLMNVPENLTAPDPLKCQSRPPALEPIKLAEYVKESLTNPDVVRFVSYHMYAFASIPTKKNQFCNLPVDDKDRRIYVSYPRITKKRPQALPPRDRALADAGFRYSALISPERFLDENKQPNNTRYMPKVNYCWMFSKAEYTPVMKIPMLFHVKDTFENFKMTLSMQSAQNEISASGFVSGPEVVVCYTPDIMKAHASMAQSIMRKVRAGKLKLSDVAYSLYTMAPYYEDPDNTKKQIVVAAGSSKKALNKIRSMDAAAAPAPASAAAKSGKQQSSGAGGETIRLAWQNFGFEVTKGPLYWTNGPEDLFIYLNTNVNCTFNTFEINDAELGKFGLTAENDHVMSRHIQPLVNTVARWNGKRSAYAGFVSKAESVYRNLYSGMYEPAWRAKWADLLAKLEKAHIDSGYAGEDLPSGVFAVKKDDVILVNLFRALVCLPHRADYCWHMEKITLDVHVPSAIASVCWPVSKAVAKSLEIIIAKNKYTCTSADLSDDIVLVNKRATETGTTVEGMDEKSYQFFVIGIDTDKYVSRQGLTIEDTSKLLCEEYYRACSVENHVGYLQKIFDTRHTFFTKPIVMPKGPAKHFLLYAVPNRAFVPEFDVEKFQSLVEWKRPANAGLALQIADTAHAVAAASSAGKIEELPDEVKYAGAGPKRKRSVITQAPATAANDGPVVEDETGKVLKDEELTESPAKRVKTEETGDDAGSFFDALAQ